MLEIIVNGKGSFSKKINVFKIMFAVFLYSENLLRKTKSVFLKLKEYAEINRIKFCLVNKLVTTGHFSMSAVYLYKNC